MDIDRQEVLNQLHRIINEQGVQHMGGRRKKRGGVSKKNLKEIDPDNYKNQYEDDGSLQFEKMYFGLIKEIAQSLFKSKEGVVPEIGAAEMKAVPEKIINQVLKGLKDKRQIEIDTAIDKLQKQEKVEEYFAPLANEQRKLDRLDAVAKKNLNNKYDLDKYILDIKYPDKYFSEVQAVPKITDSSYKNILDSLKGKGLKKYNEEEECNGGRKKRAPSKYNKFISKYMEKHKGATLADAAKHW